ncbi:hypothetical protein HDU76_006156 [Blyttiomyces sp. JEL0837]|nr:hypothetical protein HDU76_006156 [Blyttiomyces sp. JEL0837]
MSSSSSQQQQSQTVRIPMRVTKANSSDLDLDLEGAEEDDAFVADEDSPSKSAGGGATRIFNKLDLRVNSVGGRIAMLLRNPQVLMFTLGAMLMLIIILAVAGSKPPARDGSYLTYVGGEIAIEHVDKKNKIVLAKAVDVKDAWRHSFYSEYYRYDVEGKVAMPMTSSAPTKSIPDDIGSGMIGLTVWSPTGHSLAWVRDNDIYVTVNPTTEVRITTDGSENIINGIADWVYEEEVLASHDAMWFSPDGTRLAYIKFNETKVPDFRLQNYFQHQYPKELTVKYPKAGAPNPVATLHIATPSASDAVSRDVEIVFDPAYPDEDRLIVEVKWATANDTLLVRMMNRVQDSQRLFVVHAVNDTWQATKVREEQNSDKAWFTLLQPITVIPPAPSLGRAHPTYLELKENDAGFMHIAYFDSLIEAKPTTWLTSGPFEVTEVSAVNAQKGIVYFMSTEQGSTQRHLYSVSLDGSGKVQLTPPKGIDWGASVRSWNVTSRGSRSGSGSGSNKDGGGIEVRIQDGENEGIGAFGGYVGYYDVSFSPGCSYYLLSYRGPDVPFQKLIGVEDHTVDEFLKKNENVGTNLLAYQMPKESFLSIPLASTNGSVEVNARMLVPNDFNPKGRKKYPLLVKVYGGPNSQYVKQTYEISFETAMASEGFVVVTIDPRGTGFKGRGFRTVVSGHLGLYETQDVIEATKYLIDKGFIDKSKVAIWGWSFGGFVTAKVIEANSGVFSVGMAVAPVTDWKYYDTVYTERYMKTPQINNDGYEKSAVTNMDGFKQAEFLLVHGTFDDNVHFQNSARLVWEFTTKQVRTYRSQFFTDSDHSMGAGQAFGELMNLLHDFVLEKFSLDCNEKSKGIFGKRDLTLIDGSGRSSQVKVGRRLDLINGREESGRGQLHRRSGSGNDDVSKSARDFGNRKVPEWEVFGKDERNVGMLKGALVDVSNEI